MAPHLKSRCLLGAFAGVLTGCIFSIVPLPLSFSLSAGFALWCLALLIVILLSGSRSGAQTTAFIAGVLLAVPCKLDASPLERFLLMCLMALPLVASGALCLRYPASGLRARLEYLFSWGNTHPVSRRPRELNLAALMQVLFSTAVLTLCFELMKAPAQSYAGFIARWFVGGVAVLAFAEMVSSTFPLVASLAGVSVPVFMNSPWRSRSITEFWTQRWNILTSQKLFRPFCFGPLAQRGPIAALCATFLLSGIIHFLLAYMALGKLTISIMCGSFFAVQPLWILAERKLRVRKWRPACAHAWTIGALAISCPLFIEPVVQLIETSWDPLQPAYLSGLAVLAFMLLISGLVTLGCLAAAPRQTAETLPA